MLEKPHSRLKIAAWCLIVLSGIGVVFAAVDYFAPNNGISYTSGALLVLVSTLLIFGASLVVHLVRHGMAWLNAILNVLLCLGLLGTAFAAYMLDAFWLTTLMLLALLAWAASLFETGKDAVEHARNSESWEKTR